MGRYDFTCEMNHSSGQDAANRWVNVQCFWKCNGWRYHMQPVYGWVICNGEERCTYNAGYPNFTENNGRYPLGDASTFYYARGHSSYNVTCQARLRSDSSYASGERWSGTATYTVDAKTHTVITYNANGGTGAPGNQDKWYGEQLWLSGTRPTRTGYTFNQWSASSGGTYKPGQEYISDPGGTVTMTATWNELTYQVSFNANGGTGAPATQTKRYTANLTLSSTKPTRSGYIFKGWATSVTGAVVYQPGGTYSNNSAVTLYAVWEVAYKKPTIASFTAVRCNSAGTADENGQYIKVGFSWTTFNNMTNIKFQYKLQTETSWKVLDIKGSQTGKSGTVSTTTGGNAILKESSYDVRVYVEDGSGANDANRTYSSIISIGTIKFPIDVKKGGKGVAFNKVAERDNAVDIGFSEIWLGGIKIIWYS